MFPSTLKVWSGLLVTEQHCQRRVWFRWRWSMSRNHARFVICERFVFSWMYWSSFCFCLPVEIFIDLNCGLLNQDWLERLGGWLMIGLSDWLACWLTYWLIDWLAILLFTGWLIVWLTGCLVVDLLLGWLTYFSLIDWLCGWVVVWFSGFWLAGCLIDWSVFWWTNCQKQQK